MIRDSRKIVECRFWRNGAQWSLDALDVDAVVIKLVPICNSLRGALAVVIHASNHFHAWY